MIRKTMYQPEAGRPGRWGHAVLAVLLIAPLLSGCITDEDPGPLPDDESPDTLPGGFAGTQRLAREAVDGGELVAAFAVATSRPDRHEEISAAHAGMKEIVQNLLKHPSAVPGDGDLPAWAFIYEPSRGADELTYAVVETDGGSGDPSIDTGTLGREELILLRTQQALSRLPETGPAQALEAALTDEQWKNASSTSEIFALYLLVAGNTGAPEWKMIVSPYELSSEKGRIVTVDGESGELEDGEDWPDRPVRGLDDRAEDVKAPGDVETFPFTVVNETHPLIQVLPRRTSTGSILFGDPKVELHTPDGEVRSLVLEEPETVESPMAGDWEVVYTWEMPDVYRSIRLHHCMPPVPHLFAQRLDICDEPEE